MYGLISGSVSDLNPLVLLFVFMPIPSCFHYCISIIELDVRDGDVSGSSFIVEDCFDYSVFFQYEVEKYSFGGL